MHLYLYNCAFDTLYAFTGAFAKGGGAVGAFGKKFGKKGMSSGMKIQSRD